MFKDMTWSRAEKKAARAAFDLAYRRECAALLARVKQMAAAAAEPDDLWALSDYLWEHRQEIDDKYDYRYSVLILVFARLLSEGWLQLSDLEALSEDKLSVIRRLEAFGSEDEEADPSD
ncbi:MAG: hypothetical protein ACP5HS_06620 [Anaerolineae bacterium]